MKGVCPSVSKSEKFLTDIDIKKHLEVEDTRPVITSTPKSFKVKSSKRKSDLSTSDFSHSPSKKSKDSLVNPTNKRTPLLKEVVKCTRKSSLTKKCTRKKNISSSLVNNSADLKIKQTNRVKDRVKYKQLSLKRLWTSSTSTGKTDSAPTTTVASSSDSVRTLVSRLVGASSSKSVRTLVGQVVNMSNGNDNGNSNEQRPVPPPQLENAVPELEVSINEISENGYIREYRAVNIVNPINNVDVNPINNVDEPNMSRVRRDISELLDSLEVDVLEMEELNSNCLTEPI